MSTIPLAPVPPAAMVASAPAMRAARAEHPAKADPASAIRIEPMPIPEPGQNQYLVRLRLRPVHPADRYALLGLYPGAPPPGKWPITPGLDGVGIVAKAGPGALRFAVGERVAVAGFPLASRGEGTWAEYVVLEEGEMVAVPENVSDEAAAQFWTNPVSMWYMLRRLETSKGDWVLFSGAGSSLARMGMHLANWMGLRTIGIVATDAERNGVIKMGADAVVSAQSEKVTARIRHLTEASGGARAALDCVGGDMTGHLACALRDGGTIVVYGMMGSDVARVPLTPLLLSRVRVEGFWLNSAVNAELPVARRKITDAVMDAVARGAIVFGATHKVFQLEDAAAAVRESLKVSDGSKVFIETP